MDRVPASDPMETSNQPCRCALSLLVALCLMPSVAAAQEQGTLSGVARTVSFSGIGEPVSGATVRVEGTELAATTDAAGSFAMEGVPQGRWTVVVEHANYSRAGIDIDAGTGERYRLFLYGPSGCPEGETCLVGADAVVEMVAGDVRDEDVSAPAATTVEPGPVRQANPVPVSCPVFEPYPAGHHPGPCTVIEERDDGEHEHVFAYDERGRMTSVRTSRRSDGAPGLATTCTWSDDDVETCTSASPDTGDVTFTAVTTHGPHGPEVAEMTSVSGHTMTTRWTYDALGCVVARSVQDADSTSAVASEVAWFDDVWQQVTTTDVGFSRRIDQARFNAWGDPLERVLDADGYDPMNIQSTYDDAGNLLTQTVTGAGFVRRETANYMCWDP